MSLIAAGWGQYGVMSKRYDDIHQSPYFNGSNPAHEFSISLPSVLLWLWQATVTEVLALSAVQIAGWAVGALLMLAMYYQHFYTVPRPGRAENGQTMQQSVSAMARQIASVSTPKSSGLQQAMVSPWDYMKYHRASMDPKDLKAEVLMEE
eukprot:scaffold373245_cov34-Prasinocladus_malaysianus.AAC.1